MDFRPSSAVGLALTLLAGGLATEARPVSKPLTPENRLTIVRELSHEYAVVRQPLPAGKKKKEALVVTGTGKVNEEKLRQDLANRGAAVQSGELVQITKIQFNRNSILFEINGGVKKRKWYQRIRVQGGMGGVGGGPVPEQQPPTAPPGPGGQEPLARRGSWILLQFRQRVPDVSADEVKQLLAAVLDFNQPTATAPWIETIPEEFREAIKQQKAVVGMNRRMVLAALGRPERKVRETKNGQETEDWIYGHPPFVTFVTFVGEEVAEVREFR